MKAIILDGSQANDITGQRVRTILTTELQTRGWDVEQVTLRYKKIGNCAGDFFCWVRTPGICQINDDNRAIAARVAGSDLLVYLTPITFGGYSSTLKRMVDHQIQNILPFFTKIEGETHHQKRYPKYADFMAIGWTDSHDKQAEDVFRYLTYRNSINFYADKTVAGVVLAGVSDEDILASVKNWLEGLSNAQPPPVVKLPENGEIISSPTEVKSALLLVGSPKGRQSTSNSLGEYLLQRLSADSIQTETVYLYSARRSPEKMQSLLDAIDTTDLVTLSFPVYIDSLPTPVIEVLETIAEHRKTQEQAHQPLFTVIANCGFPEAGHNTAAVAICATFARQAGFRWAGSLALGGGGMISGRPLAQAGGQTVRVRKSLDMAAASLARGLSIPQSAQDLLARPFIPAWVYCLFGNFGWQQQSRNYGVRKLLKRQPYTVESD